MVIDDTPGEENITFIRDEGKMRFTLSNKGITMINDLGEIQIKCNNLIIESEGDANFNIAKELKIESGGEIAIEAQNGIKLKSDKDVIVKGKKIKLKGSTGVTAKSKQIAVKGDSVFGIDIHDILIPPTPVKTPIPHPYMGKIMDKTSRNVMVKGKPAAILGSKSGPNGPGHIPMGGPFAKVPDNKGVVTKGCVKSVKVNGKAVAVIGSDVKTCADPVAKENSKVVAAGVAMPILVDIPGYSMDKFKRKGTNLVDTRSPIGKGPNWKAKNRKLASPKWSQSKAVMGDEVTMEVQCTNLYRGATVYFTVWEEGADKKKDQPVAETSGFHENDKASAKWRYTYIHDPQNPLTEKPKFTFVADSFLCDDVESSAVEYGDKIEVDCFSRAGKNAKGQKYIFIKSDQQQKQGKMPDNGKFDELDLPPGQCKLTVDFNDDK